MMDHKDSKKYTDGADASTPALASDAVVAASDAQSQNQQGEPILASTGTPAQPGNAAWQTGSPDVQPGNATGQTGSTKGLPGNPDGFRAQHRPLAKLTAFFLAGLLIAALLMAGFNIATDPFGVFGDRIFNMYDYNMNNNPRVAKIAYLDQHHHRYDSYVLGGSKSSSFSPELLNTLLPGQSFYNSIIYGGDFYDYETMIRYFVENYTVRHLVLHVNVVELQYFNQSPRNSHIELSPRVLGAPDWQYFGKYLALHPRYGMDKIEARMIRRQNPMAFATFIPETGVYNKTVRDAEDLGSLEDFVGRYPDFAQPLWRLPGVGIEQSLEALERIVSYLDEHGVRFTMVTAPTYFKEMDRYDPDDIRRLWRGFAEITDFWDFSGYHAVSYEPRNFYDPMHYRNHIGDFMVWKVFGEGQQSDRDSGVLFDGFGHLTTRENVEARLDVMLDANLGAGNAGTIWRARVAAAGEAAALARGDQAEASQAGTAGAEKADAGEAGAGVGAGAGTEPGTGINGGATGKAPQIIPGDPGAAGGVGGTGDADGAPGADGNGPAGGIDGTDGQTPGTGTATGISPGGGIATTTITGQSDKQSVTLPILVYHLLLEEEPDPSNPYLVDIPTAAKFESDLLAIKAAGYETVLMRDVLHFMDYGTPLPAKPLMITFDDGYLSDYTIAYPLLKKHGMHAVLNVIGWSVGLDHNPATGQRIIPHFSWEQAREMEASGVIEIQSHSYDMHNHAPAGSPGTGIRNGVLKMPGEDYNDYLEALTKDERMFSEQMLAALGRRPVLFVYPYGYYTSYTESFFRQKGYRATMTVEEGLNLIRRGYPETLFKLKRYDGSAWLTSEQVVAQLQR